MNISREKAESVAYKLTQPLRDRTSQIVKDIHVEVQKFVDTNTPQEIKTLAQERPEWIQKRSVRVYGVGTYLSHDCVWKAESITVPESVADVLTKLQYSQKDANDKSNKTYNQIVTTILTLKTYARCKEAFPEAFELLPKASVSTSLTINVDSIRESLKV